ncbi:hypothetical protein [Haliangium sp. UPWRP_2]|uniref:hypothetical protein n=1 Tax=Haliangium sp. UPWRP_2 TaxID=1931276 RepID=UPI000D0D94A5|nr:hypothetical protein [Haliangium sp. UPWRP_2]
MMRLALLLAAALPMSAHADLPATSQGLALTACGCTGGSDCCNTAKTSPDFRKTPVFTYEEARDSLAFHEPDTVQVRRKTKDAVRTCWYSIAEKKEGTAWSGQDLRNAFADPAVQAALAARRVFASSLAGAKLSIRSSSVIWQAGCKSCPSAPQAIEKLQEILHAILRERALSCHASTGRAAW